jgi:hypothetical protein
LNSECDIRVKPRSLVTAGAPTRAGNRPNRKGDSLGGDAVASA